MPVEVSVKRLQELGLIRTNIPDKGYKMRFGDNVAAILGFGSIYAEFEMESPGKPESGFRNLSNSNVDTERE